MAKRQKPLKTYAELAAHFSVSVRTVENWRQYPDWPARNKDGSFNLRKITAFLKRHQLGEFNPVRNGNAGKLTYSEQRAAYLHERTENERIRKENAQIEQAQKLGQIVLVDDIRRDVAQMIAVVVEVINGTHDAVDRELPEDFLGRDRILEIIGRQHAMISAAVDVAFKGESE